MPRSQKNQVNSISLFQHLLIFTIITLNLKEVKGSITGQLKSSISTINQLSVYSFYLNDYNAPIGGGLKQLKAGSLIQITFSQNDYDDFFKQFINIQNTNASFSLSNSNCYTLYGFGNGETLNCTVLSKNYQIQIQLTQNAELPSLGFAIANIINAGSAKTVNFRIDIFDSSNQSIDSTNNQLSSNFSLALTPDSLQSIQISNSNDTVGNYGNLTILIQTKNKVIGGCNIILQFPKWGPFQNSFFLNNRCNLLSLNQTNYINNNSTCTFQSLAQYDMITVQNAFNQNVTAGQTLIFIIQNVRNSPSLRGVNNITIMTQTIKDLATVDMRNDGFFAASKQMTAPASNYNIQFLNPVVSTLTQMMLTMQISNPLLAGGVIKLTVPPEIRLQDSSLTISYLNTIYSKGKNSGNLQFNLQSSSVTNPIKDTIVITNAIQQNMNAGEFFFIYFQNMFTPVSSKTTKPFKIEISEQFQNVQYLVEGNYEGVVTNVNQQNLTSFTFSSSNRNVFTPFDSNIIARFIGIVQKDDYIELQYPSQFILNPNQNLSNIICSSTLSSQTLSGPCHLTQNNRTIRIQQVCNQDVDYSAGGGFLNFTIQNLFLNPDSEMPVNSGFLILLKDPSGNIIASYNPLFDVQANLYQAQSLSLNAFKVQPYKQMTGQATTLNFQGFFQGFFNYSQSQLNIIIIPPSQIQFQDTSSIICVSNTNKSLSNQCQSTTYNNQQAVKVQFLNIQLQNTSIIQIDMDIGTYINPLSTQITDSFQLFITNQQGYKIAQQTQGIFYSLSQGSPFQSVIITPQSTINGDSTRYNFQIVSMNPIPSQSTIQILPPQGVIFSTFSGTNIQCTGFGILNQKILCYLIQNQIVINLFFDQAPQIQTLNFTLFPVINPPSLKPTQSFIISASTKNGFIISQQNQNITVQNSRTNTIIDANVLASNPTLGADSSYMIQFKPINPLPVNSIIQVYVPTILQRDMSENLNCSSSLNSSLATIWPCQYNDTLRIVTVYPQIINFDNLPSKIKFYINGFQNPMQPKFDESFQIFTFDQYGFAMDQITSGLQVSQNCDYPCLTCGLSQSTCLSCKIGDLYQYLFNNTCIQFCPSGFFEDSSFICKQCSSQCQQCKGSANFCSQCSNKFQNLFVPTGTCTDNCPAGQFSDKGTGSCTNCEASCKICSGINQCSSCQDNFLLYNGTCRKECPSNMVASPDQHQCINCLEPCQSCSVTPDKCTACDQNSGNPYLYGSKCVSKCPAGYSGSFLNPYQCEITKEQIIPFVFLAVVIFISLLIGIVKLCKKDNFHYKNTLIALISVVCQANWAFVLYLTIEDEQVQSTVIICFGLGMLYILNFVFFCLHMKVMRKDEFYSHWRNQNRKKECILIFLALVTNFQFYRLIFQSLSIAIKSKISAIEENIKQTNQGDAEANKTQTDLNIEQFKSQDENTVKQIFNQLTIIMMTCVLAPIIVQNIYNLFFTFPGRQLFWEDIESIFITFFLLLVLIYDTIKKSKKIQFLKLQKLQPKDTPKNDLSGIPKDLTIKTVSNDIDNLDQLLGNSHEVKRFRDILSALLKNPKYIASQEDDLSSIKSPEIVKQKRQSARMNRAGMNNEIPQNFEMTGVNGATMRVADTTMHTEENFMGTSTDRNLLNGSTLKENHNIFTDRSLIVKNIFLQNKTEREYRSPIDENEGDEDDANVRSSISPNLKKRISSQIIEQSHENVNTDHYNSNNITNRDFDDLNRQNIHGGTDSAIIKQLQQSNIENLRDSKLNQESYVHQETHFIQKKSMIKERSNELKQNNRLLRSHQQPLTGILQENQVNDHLITDVSQVNEVIIQKQEEKLKGLSSLKTVQDHFSLVSTSQLKSEPEQMENVPQKTQLNKQIEINEQMDNSYEQREGGALQMQSLDATPTNYHLTLGVDKQIQKNIFGLINPQSSKNEQSQAFSFKQTPYLSMGDNTENKTGQISNDQSNKKIVFNQVDVQSKEEEATQRVSLLTTDDNFNKDIKVCQDLNQFKKQENTKLISEREQEINQLVMKQKESSETFLRPLNKTIQITDNKESNIFQFDISKQEGNQDRPSTVIQESQTIDKNDFFNKPKEALKESSWLQKNELDQNNSIETDYFSGSSQERKRKKGEWKLKQISSQIKIKNQGFSQNIISQNQTTENYVDATQQLMETEKKEKIDFKKEEKSDDEQNNNVSPQARTVKRKKRIVKKLIQINEDGSKQVIQQDNMVHAYTVDENIKEGGENIQNINLLGLQGLGQGLIEQDPKKLSEARPIQPIKNVEKPGVAVRKSDQDLSSNRIRSQNQLQQVKTEKQITIQNSQNHQQKEIKQLNVIQQTEKTVIQKNKIDENFQLDKSLKMNFEKDEISGQKQEQKTLNINQQKPPIYDLKSQNKFQNEESDYLDQQLQNMENQSKYSRMQKFAKTSEKSQKNIIESSGAREMNMTLQNFKKNMDQQLNNQMGQTMQGFSENQQQIKSMLSKQESGSFEVHQFNATRTVQISNNGSQYQFNGTQKSGFGLANTNQLLNTERKEKDILKKSANYRVGKAIVEGSSYENMDKRSSSHDHWGQGSSKNFENFSSPPKKFNENGKIFVNPSQINENTSQNQTKSNRQLQYEGGYTSF